MATRREIRSDVILRLTKGKPSDDFEVDDRQINFWIDNVRSSMIQDKIDDGMVDLQDFISRFDNICIETELVETKNIEKNLYKIKLPADVLDLPNDIGVYDVETEGGTQVTRIRPTDRKRFKNLRFAKPGPSRPSFYRVSEHLYFEGGGDNWLRHGAVNLLLIASSTIDSVSDDEPYPISSDMIASLIDACEMIGLREIQTEEDLLNDGE